MDIEQTIPVRLWQADVQHFLAIARDQGKTVPELLQAILEDIAEDDRKEMEQR